MIGLYNPVVFRQSLDVSKTGITLFFTSEWEKRMDENKVRALHDEILEVMLSFRYYFGCPMCLQDFSYKQVFLEDSRDRLLSNTHTIPPAL
jgi:hypothetical protein